MEVRSINGEFEKTDLKDILPQRIQDSHKGTYGRALIIAGSPGMAGAAYLAGMAAYRSGCGLVEILTCEENRVILQQLIPEAVMTLYDAQDVEGIKAKIGQAVARADAVALGCGLGTDQAAELIVHEACSAAVKEHKPLLADADAITLIGQDMALLNSLRGQSVVFTPHPKEMCSLTQMTVDEIQANRERIVTGFSTVSQTSCLLKGHRTLVAAPSGECYENETGNSGMAVGGSGDVLSGLITGLAAQGMDLYAAACAGALIHGHAGELAAENMGERAMMARDLLEGLEEAMFEIEDDEWEDEWDEEDE